MSKTGKYGDERTLWFGAYSPMFSLKKQKQNTIHGALLENSNASVLITNTPKTDCTPLWILTHYGNPNA